MERLLKRSMYTVIEIYLYKNAVPITVFLHAYSLNTGILICYILL